MMQGAGKVRHVVMNLDGLYMSRHPRLAVLTVQIARRHSNWEHLIAKVGSQFRTRDIISQILITWQNIHDTNETKYENYYCFTFTPIVAMKLITWTLRSTAVSNIWRCSASMLALTILYLMVSDVGQKCCCCWNWRSFLWLEVDACSSLSSACWVGTDGAAFAGLCEPCLLKLVLLSDDGWGGTGVGGGASLRDTRGLTSPSGSSLT